MTSTGRAPATKQALATDVLLKDYRLRLKDNTRSLRENFTEILKIAKVPVDPENADRRAALFSDIHEMEVRASNMARSGEALLKLVSDLKQFCCLNDFAFINRTIEENNTFAAREIQHIDAAIATLRDHVSTNAIDFQLELTTGITPTVPTEFQADQE